MISEQFRQDCEIAAAQGDRTGERPRPTGPARSSFPLGIALGGGAARGLSHIGVLKVLADHGVNFPVVTGTSMGAIVGAAYVCGKLAEIEAVARSITPITMSGWFDMNLLTGALKGDAVKEVFRQFIGDTTFADLRDRGISFAVVAADLDKEEPVYISDGRVDDAVRASMSIPGVFEPVSLGGRVLVDGGLMDNVPVDAARSLGAQIVVAVEVLNTYDIWTRAALRLGFSVVQLREMRARLRQMASEQRDSRGSSRDTLGDPVSDRVSDLLGDTVSHAVSDFVGDTVSEGRLSAGLPFEMEQEEAGAPHDFTIPVLNRFKWSLSTQAPEQSVAEVRAGKGKTAAGEMQSGKTQSGKMQSGKTSAELRSSLKTTLDALDIIASVLEDGRLPFRANSRADVFIRPDVSKYHAHQFYRASQLIALGERAAREALPDIMALAAGHLTHRSQ